MSLLSGLEKFGLNVSHDVDILAEDKEGANGQRAVKAEEKKVDVPPEESFILEKSIRCPVCDKVFKTKTIKSGRVKRLEPDKDLRPRHQYIDTLKYDICSCPNCGYTAMHRYFPHVSPTQAKLLKDEICSDFHPRNEPEPAAYDYDMAIDRYKLSLYNTMVKRGKVSEKAYTCLKIAWLYRGKAETMNTQTQAGKMLIEDCKEQEEKFYQQAYDGFMKAVSTEMFPICGMDQGTMDFLLSAMSIHYKKYDVASKLLAGILSNPSSSRSMKDKALVLKEEVVAELKKARG